ncbi:MAG: SDR family oxidoreductase [Candidatus Thiodiazotropha sp. (ex Myrtea sp. 'scaly one' KF741663)]|nr:SDR family oxidoreductase [Candidatus Thiodiazotropha sp. (ex Myrtea sp. 'scaly one' KF741663)]
MRILILGISGMLGNAVFRHFSSVHHHDVVGTLRSHRDLAHFPAPWHERIITGVDVLQQDGVINLLSETRPDVVINCVGLIKQLSSAKDPLVAVPINSLFPHRLSRLCQLAGCRLIHISTDCVFSGRSGNYLESDLSDADDLYGKSKHIGEVNYETNAITLRTSIIGHELHSNHALVDWFLNSSEQVKGFTKAIFSGLPTIELARIIHDHVLPVADLHGLFHVSTDPITKYDLLTLIASIYKKDIEIVPSVELIIDRSLNSDLFKSATGYQPPVWPDLIKTMHNDYLLTKGPIDV